ncbi:type IV secretory system conjugative DNA transfer family protein [Actinoplanes regularis]|uniref:type IV secretory system conjugative DNA transfer family protein n=1 Tax=Actinoplanes regularis TaxID=52697 RepID=UPI0024A389A7|nr:DUF87 domain-containing protein [Actinoplanes regularis]GLW32290.1 hypothetical protein Areg01_52290 [Actinoplanes regularis]
MTDAERAHSVARVVYRYVSGRPLSGRGGYPYLRPGMGRLAGWQRQVWRLGAPALTSLAAAVPDYGIPTTASGLALVAAASGQRHLRHQRFRRAYVAPTLAAMSPALGVYEDGIRLHVDPALGTLTKRLAKPLSPAERAARLWYGEHVEPLVRWLPDQIQRGIWALQRTMTPVTRRLEVFRRPSEEYTPRIELEVGVPYLTSDQVHLVSSIINSKVPVSDLIERWDMVGPKVRARWTVRKRPPAVVDYDRVVQYIDQLKEWEFYLGQGAGNEPVVISLRDDSPHIAVSAGSGAGKSVLAMLIAVQVLRRGGRVVILDRKGSHRWAIGQKGVDYCTKPQQMHDALIRVAAMADERNDLALYEDDDWNPGERHFVICEELNATIGQLSNYWAEVREKGDPKKSPAISALADLLFMGRSANVNVLAIAQMLTARAIGGPEARENFGIRCLARYTTNNWKMLVPEASMPRSSRTLGRWQIVIGGQSTETQVAYLTTPQARALANPAEGLDKPLNREVTDNGNMLTLREAIDAGVLPWKSYEAAKQRLYRGTGKVPQKRGKQGRADLYTQSDLEQWAASCKEEVS